MLAEAGTHRKLSGIFCAALTSVKTAVLPSLFGCQFHRNRQSAAADFTEHLPAIRTSIRWEEPQPKSRSRTSTPTTPRTAMQRFPLKAAGLRLDAALEFLVWVLVVLHGSWLSREKPTSFCNDVRSLPYSCACYADRIDSLQFQGGALAYGGWQRNHSRSLTTLYPAAPADQTMMLHAHRRRGSKEMGPFSCPDCGP